MTSVWRLVLMCLLSVALPVQGVAAAGMAGCGPNHHDTALPHASYVDHHDAAGYVHGHEPAHAVSLADSGHHDHSHGKPSKSSSSDKCSACSSCCVAAALPSFPIVLTSPVLTDPFAPLAPSGVTAFLSECLERPPRLVLA